MAIPKNVTAESWPNIKNKPEVLQDDTQLPSRHILKRKAAAEVRTSDTLTIDATLQAEVEADTVYEGTICLKFNDAKSTPDFSYEYPSGATLYGWMDAGAIGSVATASSAVFLDQTFAKEAVTGLNRHGFVLGFVLAVGSTAGTFGLKWAKKALAVDSEMSINSYMTLTKGV